MTKQTVDIGTNPNDSTGDNIRDCFDMLNDNFDELYNAILSAPQTVTYSTTPTHNFNSGANGVITLTGNVTTYSLANVEDGAGGTIKVVQNGTGGYGISAIAHSGLSIEYVNGKSPTAVNINSGADEETIISYLRLGSTVYIIFPLKALATQTISYSSTATMDYNDGADGVITLTGDVTTLTLSNVEDTESGEIVIIQNGTGGYGIAAIVHSGLTIKYIDNAAPIAANINSGASAHTVLSYKCVGSYLYVTYGKFGS